MDKKCSDCVLDFLRKNSHSESQNFMKTSKCSEQCLEKSMCKKMSSACDNFMKNCDIDLTLTLIIFKHCIKIESHMLELANNFILAFESLFSMKTALRLT